MYMAAINGAEMSTDRATSFSGLRHSSEKIAAPSKPLRAETDIFVNTFTVTSVAAGKASDSELCAPGRPLSQALLSRKTSTTKVAIISTVPELLHHLARCNPRTLKAYAITQARAVTTS